jgi:hypothetical protein
MRYEVFHVPTDYTLTDDDGEPLDEGWYWWYVQAGCLPDSDASGPFKDEEGAAENAEEDYAELLYWDHVNQQIDEARGK